MWLIRLGSQQAISETTISKRVHETYRSIASTRIKAVMRGRRVLWILRVVSLALIIARWSIVWRSALHAYVVIGVGKIILPYSALTDDANGEY